jgi:ubiquinone/menaquinone biosynthesis C-methylase UbiE
LKIRVFIFATLSFVLAYNGAATASSSCQQSLHVASTENRVLYNAKIRKNVREFLKRQLNYDEPIRLEMQSLLIKEEQVNSKGQVTISLEVLNRLRQYLEAKHPELLATRPIHGKTRLHRRIDELSALVRNIDRLDFRLRNLSTTTLLDIGAGNGQIVSGLAGALGLRQQNVFALELAEYPNRATDVQWISYNEQGEIPLPDNSVDIITLMMVLHHAPDPMALIKEMHRVLKTGGVVVVRETNAGSQNLLGLSPEEMVALNQILDNMLYVVFDPNSGVPMMNNYRPINYWEDLFRKAGFKTEIFSSREPGSPFQPLFVRLTKR